jgi:exodeoxyribonuclease V alpha subunit
MRNYGKDKRSRVNPSLHENIIEQIMEQTPLDQLFARFAGDSAPELVRSFFARLMAHSRAGHLCMKSQEIIQSDQIGDAAAGGSLRPIIHYNGCYYLQSNWILETTIVRRIQQLMNTAPHSIVNESALSISPMLTKQQASVVRNLALYSLTIVTGGPGTGKTFTAAQALQALCSARSTEPALRVKIAAPTGKAADCLAKMIPKIPGLDIESMTLHRLLSLRPGRSRLFMPKMIEADLVVVDEASMIDASLFAHLLVSITDGTRLLMLGDADQLPPVAGGGVFAQLAQTLAIRLEESHRIRETALFPIYRAALDGNVKVLDTILKPMPKDTVSWMWSLVEPLIFTARPDPVECLQRFDRWRIICPLRKGLHGVDALNRALLKKLQRSLLLGQWWAAPLLVTENDAAMQVYNGSSGIVIGQFHSQILSGTEEVILADGRSLMLRALPGYEITFALSVHKSQGSEFDNVALLLPEGSEEFGLEALYTAVTRAKRSVRLIGSSLTLKKMMVRCQQENNLARVRQM